MRAGHLAFAAVTIALAFLAPCNAQELDVFELTDFVDPRLRGAEIGSDLRVTDPGSDYRYFRAIVGGVANYSSRTRPTEGNLAFIHLSGSMYFGLNQLNFKVTTLKANEAGSRPRLRVTSQYGIYSYSWFEDAETHKREATADRYLFTVSTEDTEKCLAVVNAQPGQGPPAVSPVSFGGGGSSSRVCKQHRESELGLEWDGSLGAATSDLMVVTLGMRKTADDGTLARGTISIRAYEHATSRARVGVAFDHSVERASSSFRFGATGVAISTSWDLRKGLVLNALWRPSYVPSQPGRRIYNEFGVFIDSTVYSRLMPRLKRVTPETTVGTTR